MIPSSSETSKVVNLTEVLCDKLNIPIEEKDVQIQIKPSDDDEITSINR